MTSGWRDRRRALRGLALILAALAVALPGRTQSTTTIPAEVQTASTSSEAQLLARQLDTLETDSTTSDATATNDAGPEGIIPVTRGFNASLGTTSQHDSAGGWSSLLTPNLAYRFNRHFSLSLGLPVFSYINVALDTTSAAGVVPSGTVTTTLVTKHFLLGDTTLAGGFDAHTRWLDYNLSATLGMPTGDDANGLGAGRTTYAFINHIERPLGDYVTPNLELGIDDSTNLLDARVRKSYTDVGTNAHFQAGFGFSLPFRINFESDAYEELPLASQTVTSTTTNGKKGKQLKLTARSSQESIGEDNGFQNTMDIPLNRHVTLSGFYNRSLRNKLDTGGFSLTFLLRAPPVLAER